MKALSVHSVSLQILLDPYKREEAVESAVVLIDDREAQKLVAYWPRDGSTWNISPLKMPKEPNEIWRWLWNGIHVNMDELALCSGVPRNLILQKYSLLQANRLIYPDHTVSGWAQKILQAEVKLRYSGKPRQ